LRNPRIEKDIIDTLVLKPESNKQMIKAVCEIFGGTYPHAFSSDFVRGKGEGQILLLHGPPGTGKTLTAGMDRFERRIIQNLQANFSQSQSRSIQVALC
jgi:DNA polymerase III delta prime subunit